MSYAHLLVSDQDAVRTITVHRPDKLNALNHATIGELHHAFAAARADAAVRVLVLTGAGPKAFVAGADISEFASATPVQARAFSEAGQQMMRSVETLGKPVIARINGFALGGGMELAMCCHLRIAAESAKLGTPEINLGILPGFGATQRLTRLCGRAAALELCLLGAPITAQRALELGIVNRVVPAAELDAEVMKVAAQLARSAPHALRAILDAVILGGDMALDQGLSYETHLFAVTASTADMREGTAAFLEKRPAQFRGT
ncbi:MAG: enoyl-CoA hydratase/isomerase family protein [Xanthomonadales bacterium]|nr:Crotonyl-CoA hydratase [Xanthomonadales bacterium]MCC6593345.1 enoyl-CoA hydratase/isomerase family protein [Xanthomonadales bacterium]MCE7930418.1 enoyl-CoA hydratase [Xanthomonadales bacterium PRO6]